VLFYGKHYGWRTNWSCGSDHLDHRAAKDNMNAGATIKPVALKILSFTTRRLL
jgi:hypothetical protein